MDTSEKDSKKCNRIRGTRPETEAKYRQAIELYRSTDLPVAEISRMCGLTNNGLRVRSIQPILSAYFFPVKRP